MFQLLTRLDVLWRLSTTGAKASGRKEDDRSSRLGNSAQRTGSMLWRGWVWERNSRSAVHSEHSRWFPNARIDQNGDLMGFGIFWRVSIRRSPAAPGDSLVASFVAGVGYVATVLGVVLLGHNLEAPVEQQPDHLTCVCVCSEPVMRVKTWANRFTSCNPSRFNEEYEPHAQNSGN